MKINHKKGLILIIVISVFFNLISFKNGTNWGGDFAGYLDQTRHLVNNSLDQYSELSDFRLRNSSDSISPTFYPWGVSLLLSPVYLVFGFNLLALKVYLYLFFVLSIVVTYKLLKDKLKKQELLVLIAFLAFNPFFFGFKENILSDYPFLFFSLLSLYMMEKFAFREEFTVNRWLSYLILAVVFFIGTSIRSIGHILIITFLIVQFIRYYQSGWQKLHKYLAPALVVLMFYGTLYFLLKSILPSSSLYAEDFFKLNPFTVLYRNLIYYIGLPSKFFQVTEDEIFAGVVFGFSIPFILMGIFLRVKKEYHYLIYILLTYSILLFYPYHQGLRFIFPLIPLVLYFFIKGFAWSINFLRQQQVLPRFIYNPLYVASTVLLILFIYADLKIMITEDPVIHNGPYNQFSQEMFEYVKDHTEKDDVIIFRKPRVMTFFTGRKSVRKEQIDSIAGFYKPLVVLDKKNQDLQIKKGDTDRYNSFVELFQNEQFEIYQFNSRISKKEPETRKKTSFVLP